MLDLMPKMMPLLASLVGIVFLTSTSMALVYLSQKNSKLQLKPLHLLLMQLTWFAAIITLATTVISLLTLNLLGN